MELFHQLFPALLLFFVRHSAHFSSMTVFNLQSILKSLEADLIQVHRYVQDNFHRRVLTLEFLGDI